MTEHRGRDHKGVERECVQEWHFCGARDGTMTRDEARALTDEIKAATEQLWALLLRAYEQRAWAALGYESWRAWATTELDVSQSRAYELLDTARIASALGAASGISGIPEIKPYDAERIKPHLGEAVEDVAELVDEGMEPRAAVEAVVEKYARPHVSNNSGNNEWYTPRDYIEPARAVLGEIDLDPASNARANEVVGAQDYFSIDDDGLAQSWYGRVWMNPPYAADLVGKFADKMVESYRAGSVLASITLVNNATETAWFQSLARAATAICFPERRIRFWSPDGELGAPLQGQALIYMGLEPGRFAEAFAPFGLIVTVEAHA